VRTSFVELLLVDEHLTGQDECLRTLARGKQSTLYQQFVETSFQSDIREHTTDVPALGSVQNAEPSVP
jgi:hypothetical protein